MDDMEISAEVETAITDIVHSDLDRFGVERVEVVPSEDADGDPALRVLIHYASADADPDPKVTAGLVIKVNNKLHAMKERRFAYMSHRVPEMPRKVRRRG